VRYQQSLVAAAGYLPGIDGATAPTTSPERQEYAGLRAPGTAQVTGECRQQSYRSLGKVADGSLALLWAAVIKTGRGDVLQWSFDERSRS
jgi:hypothetical protein